MSSQFNSNDRLRQLKNELNAIKNSNLTESQYLNASSKQDDVLKGTDVTLQKVLLGNVMEQTNGSVNIKTNNKRQSRQIEIDSDSEQDEEEQKSQTLNHTQKSLNPLTGNLTQSEKLLVDQIHGVFQSNEIQDEDQYKDKKLLIKANQQKEGVQKHLKILKRNLEKDLEQAQEKLDETSKKVQQSNDRKIRTQQLLDDMTNRLFQAEKMKLLAKSQRDSLQRDLNKE